MSISVAGLRAHRGVVALGLALTLCACATRSAPPAPSPGAEASSARADANGGLGLTGAETPEALKAIATAPYRLEEPPECATIARGIADLDRLLGPDLDAPADDDRRAAAERLVMGVVRGAIPYRWAVRWLTQAGRKDRELQRAILAGVARRGYLKGVRRGLACPPIIP